MTERQGRERALILVKALPHAARVGETVCCAGITEQGEWRRQFPIRFRHLRDEKKFSRWQWIEYQWRKPTDDLRTESRRVQEETIITGSFMKERERAGFLQPLIVGSTAEASSQGKSLALIRPRNIKFSWKKKTASAIEKEREVYAAAARQKSFFDEDLDALEPCPYEFYFHYDAEDGSHENTCQDWETSAMFWSLKKQYGESKALQRMDTVFNVEYPRKGMAFAMGTHSRYPSWLLIGVIRLDVEEQFRLL